MSFKIIQDQFDLLKESYYETIFTLANGYVGLRNTLNFESNHSRPGSFFSEIYENTLATNNEIVNCPSWLNFEIEINNETIDFDSLNIESFERELNMEKGIVNLKIIFKDKDNRLTEYVKTDLIHSKYIHNARHFGYIKPLNYSGKISISTFFDYRKGNTFLGGSVNKNVEIHHLELISESYFSNNLVTIFKKNSEDYFLSLFHDFRIYDKNDVINTKKRKIKRKKQIGEKISFSAYENIEYFFEKKVGFIHSNDFKNMNIMISNNIKDIFYIGLEDFKHTHFKNMKQKWEVSDIKVDGKISDQIGVRFSIFHLIQSIHPTKKGINIASRGLTSEYHQGHFFFNTEIYCAPFFTYTHPNITKSLLEYRFNTLNNACKLANREGNNGARFSEQSDLNGNPGGPEKIKNIMNGRIYEEFTGRESKFIGGLITYSIYKYYTQTGDIDFLLEKGLPLIYKISQYYLDILEFSEEEDNYKISNVIGPDEYHIHVNNNYFTNYLVKKNFEILLDINKKCLGVDKDKYFEVKDKFDINKNTLEQIKMVKDKIYLPTKSDDIFEQFDGYFNLEEEFIPGYDQNNRPIISNNIRKISSSFDNNSSQIIKQSDVIMLLSLFKNDFSFNEKRNNLTYYEKRTIHESSLSTCHAATIAHDIDDFNTSYNYFRNSIRFNLDFYPKENYNNGIHLAGGAGGLLVLIESFAGINIFDNNVYINPKFPPQIRQINLNIRSNNQLYNINITNNIVKVTPFKNNEKKNTLTKFIINDEEKFL